ncbi:MAG: hypothetical protein FJ147_17285 [Deltaproteobacteria bacterium]|nr:hypothetical protein [Deltaproteobacteria bacterium]
MVQAQNPQEAHRRGYNDGSQMAEQMRWKGTPIGHLSKGSYYDPDRQFHAAYDDGFKQAMNAASRVEWTMPRDRQSLGKPQNIIVGAKGLLSAL